MLRNNVVLWIAASLPPKAVSWAQEIENVTAQHVFDLGYLSADDNTIFDAAKNAGNNIIIVTKDEENI